MKIKSTDSLVVSAKTEAEAPILEYVHVTGIVVMLFSVQLWDESDYNLYPHHHIMLASFPICLARGTCHPVGGDVGETGNFMAVGSFTPGIEIWDLDVMEALKPVVVLGGEDTEAGDDEQQQPIPSEETKAQKKRRKRKENKHRDVLKPGSHTEAVMCLDWHKRTGNLIASGSADTTIKIWDIFTQQPITTYTHHTDKVCCRHMTSSSRR